MTELSSYEALIQYEKANREKLKIKGVLIMTEEYTGVVKDDIGKSRMDLLPESAEQFSDELFGLYMRVNVLRTEGSLKELGVRLMEHTNLLEVGQVLAFGASKYSAESWKTIDDVDRYWSALGRHVWKADIDPESTDAESGLTHFAHAMTNVLFILDLEFGVLKSEEVSKDPTVFGPPPEPIVKRSLAELRTAARERLHFVLSTGTTHNYPQDLREDDDLSD